MLSFNEILAIILPWSIFAVNLFVKSSEDDGKVVPWRPEGYIFGIVWTMLVIFMSLSWYLALNSNMVSNTIINMLFMLVILSAVMWQVLYHKKSKKSGITVFVFLLFALVPLIMYLYYTQSIYSAMLLMPLLIWVILAMIMNIEEVKKEAETS